MNTTTRRRAPGLRHCAATYSSIACEKMVWRGCEVKRLVGFATSFFVATALAGCGAPPQGQSGTSTSVPSGQQGGTAELPRYNPASGDPNGCEPFVTDLVEAQCAYAILEIEPRSLPALREETSPQRDAGAKRLLAILAAGRAASCGAVVEDGKFNGNLNAQISSSWSQPRPEACKDAESEYLCRKKMDQYIPPPLNISNIRRMLEYCRTEAPSRARKQCSESSCMAAPVEAAPNQTAQSVMQVTESNSAKAMMLQGRFNLVCNGVSVTHNVNESTGEIEGDQPQRKWNGTIRVDGPSGNACMDGPGGCSSVSILKRSADEISLLYNGDGEKIHIKYESDTGGMWSTREVELNGAYVETTTVSGKCSVVSYSPHN